MNHDAVLNKIKSTVINDFPSAKIILFGSRSRGTASQYSDWDVLIIINEVISEKEKIELHNKIFEIELAYGEIINAIIHTRQEWNDPLMKSTPFFQSVVKEGITV